MQKLRPPNRETLEDKKHFCISIKKIKWSTITNSKKIYNKVWPCTIQSLIINPCSVMGVAYPSYPIHVCFVCEHLITLPNHARKNNMIWTNEKYSLICPLCIVKTESGISPNLSMGIITCATSESINSIIRGMWLYSKLTWIAFVSETLQTEVVSSWLTLRAHFWRANIDIHPRKLGKVPQSLPAPTGTLTKKRFLSF